jgi:enoyl-[acyl-carrier protein] reductase I
MSFLHLAGKKILILGVANKRSVAYHTAKVLEEAGAEVIHSVATEAIRESVGRLLADREVHVCDVEQSAEIQRLAAELRERHGKIDGLLHSLAFANYEAFTGTFHEVRWQDFAQAMHISCFSLIELANALREVLSEDASVVTISISSTAMAAEAYGYMAPVKAALDSTLVFLAKSFSRFSKVRFNAVKAGLLKTSASAGIPDYVDNYLYAEQVTLRKRALDTAEIAQVASFLLSPRSSGINAQGIVVDAGMAVNYFDREVVRRVVEGG